MKTFIFVLVVAVGVVIAFGFYWYTKKPIDTRRTPAEFSLTAEQLSREFNENEELAASKYLEKIIEVKGGVSQVIIEGDNVSLFLNTEDPIHGLVCNFYETEALAISELAVGNEVTIKGKCTGKLMDVVLSNCVLEK